MLFNTNVRRHDNCQRNHLKKQPIYKGIKASEFTDVEVERYNWGLGNER